MVVNHDVAAMRMASQVDLGHELLRDGVQPVAADLQDVGLCILQLQVQRIHMEVVDIHQQAAAGAPRQCGEKAWFVHVGAIPPDVGGEVFNGDRASELLLHPLYVVGHDCQRFVGEGDGQQVGGMEGAVTLRAAPRTARETCVVTHAGWLYALHQPRQAVQMPGVQPGRRPERQADAVQAHGVQGAALLQNLQCRPAISEEVFGVHLQKTDGGLPLQQLTIVGVPPADAGLQGVSSS